jgi:YD repeat-containing protein
LAPDGTKYYFDYLVGGQRISTYFDLPARQGRQWVTMYASKVVDRFGNSVNYHYTGGRLTSITTNDGRKVAIAWRDDYNVISSVSTIDAQTNGVLQTWTYEYVAAGYDNLVYLSRVILPDGSDWIYTNLRFFDLFSSPTQASCGERVRQSPTTADAFSTIKAPSGAVATFGHAYLVRGYSHTGYLSSTANCTSPHPYGSPFEFSVMFARENGLISKSIEGPGLTPQTWTYRYSDAVASWVHDPCYASNSCVTTRTSSEINPDGTRTNFTFTTVQGSKLEGKVLRTQWLDSQLVVKKETTVTYAPFNQGPWPARLGGNPIDANVPAGAHVADSYISPVQGTTTRLDGVAFSTTVNAFDAYARPLSVTKASAPSP